MNKIFLRRYILREIYNLRNFLVNLDWKESPIQIDIKKPNYESNEIYTYISSEKMSFRHCKLKIPYVIKNLKIKTGLINGIDIDRDKTLAECKTNEYIINYDGFLVKVEDEELRKHIIYMFEDYEKAKI